MRGFFLLPFLITLVLVPVFALADIDPAAVVQECERIENLRILHAYAIEDVHDAKALAMYLQGWGGPDRSGEAETLMQEAEDVYGLLTGIESGSQALLAEIDAYGKQSPSSAQLELLQRARRSVAAPVNSFYARCKALKAELAQQVKSAASQKTKWQLTSQPEPWPNAAREAGRAAGFQRGIFLRDNFFALPPGDIDYCLAKAARIGIAYAHVLYDPACNWAAMEPQPGQYSFAALDKMLATFAKHKIRVCLMLRSLTGAPPEWCIEKFKNECQLTVTSTDRQGKQTQQVGGINIMHQPTGEAYAKFLAALAGHLKQAGVSQGDASQIDAVFVEGAQPEIEAPADESPAMDAYWRTWSKTDAAWRTPEAILAAQNPDLPASVKAEQCREAWLLDYIRAMSAALKQGWAELPVQTMTANDDFHRLHASATGKSRNVYALAQVVDNPVTSTSSTPCFELLRSFANGRWLWQWAMHTGSGATPSADFAQSPFHDVSRVGEGWLTGNIIRLAYPANWARYPDRQLSDFGVISYFLSPRRSQELAPITLNTAAAPAQVAILWSQATRRIDTSHELFMDAISWGHLLKRIQVDFDYIADDGAGFDVSFANRLKTYKLLILPNTQAMSAATCDAIRAWVNQGGVLLGFGAPGIYDENGTRRPGIPLADVFGADVARMRLPGLIRPDKLETTHPEGAYTPLPPLDYKFRTNLTAALKPQGGTPRAWFVGEPEEVAIVENTVGQGKAMLSGFPIGHEYWKTDPYEISFGLTYFRLTSVHEGSRYEAWVLAELEKRGVVRNVILPQGMFLRAQNNDDPDWTHTYRNGPEYSEYVFEEERPVRAAISFCRKREGIDNVYVGLSHTEGNYSVGRGYFRCTLSGATITASAAVPGQPAPAANDVRPAPVVFDARLAVPVPSTAAKDRVTFTTWLPMARSAAFAVAPAGNVRLFGDAPASGRGISADGVAAITAEYEKGAALAEVEVLDPSRISQFLKGLASTAPGGAAKAGPVVIACGDTRFRPVADELARWLKTKRQVDARVTTEGPRATCRRDYMLGWGYLQPMPEPVSAAILIGNCQDNGLMWKFVTRDVRPLGWLPLEINQNFPGFGRAVVMLASPVQTSLDGKPADKKSDPQLVIGASYPAEAMKAVLAVEKIK